MPLSFQFLKSAFCALFRIGMPSDSNETDQLAEIRETKIGIPLREMEPRSFSRVLFFRPCLAWRGWSILYTSLPVLRSVLIWILVLETDPFETRD